LYEKILYIIEFQVIVCDVYEVQILFILHFQENGEQKHDDDFEIQIVTIRGN